MKPMSKLLRAKPRPCFVPRSRVENKKNLEEGKEDHEKSSSNVEEGAILDNEVVEHGHQSPDQALLLDGEPPNKTTGVKEEGRKEPELACSQPSHPDRSDIMVIPPKRFKFKPKLHPNSNLKELEKVEESEQGFEKKMRETPSNCELYVDNESPASFEVYKENDQLFLISKVGDSEDISIIEVSQENNPPSQEVTLPPSPIKILKPVPKLPNMARSKAQPIALETVKAVVHERPKAPSSTYGRLQKEIQERFVKRFGNGPPDYTKLTMLDLIYYNPAANPMNRHDEEVVMNVGDSLTNTVESEGSSEGDCENVTVLTLDSEGNIIISDDPSSKVIEKENPTVKSRHSWSKADTIKFYKALHRIGADFSVMTKVFPDRDRKNLKSKFKREERVNPTLIDKVLSNPAQFNFEALQQELDDFSEVYSKKPQKKMTLSRVATPHEDYGGLAPKKHTQTVSERNFTGLTVNSWETTEDLLGISLPVAMKKFHPPRKLPSKQIKKNHSKKSPPKSLVRSLQAIIAEQEREQSESLTNDPAIPYKSLLNLTKAFSVNSESLSHPADINITIEHEPEPIDSSESPGLCVE